MVVEYMIIWNFESNYFSVVDMIVECMTILNFEMLMISLNFTLFRYAQNKLCSVQMCTMWTLQNVYNLHNFTFTERIMIVHVKIPSNSSLQYIYFHLKMNNNEIIVFQNELYVRSMRTLKFIRRHLHRTLSCTKLRCDLWMGH